MLVYQVNWSFYQGVIVMIALPTQMNYVHWMRNVNNASAFLKVGSFYHRVRNIKMINLSFNPYIGCDCDENSPNPDELCPANQKCKQCKCLLEGKNYYSEITFWTLVYFSGCDCDENSLNPDELCPANEKCKNCKCIAKGRVETWWKMMMLQFIDYFSLPGLFWPIINNFHFLSYWLSIIGPNCLVLFGLRFSRMFDTRADRLTGFYSRSF